MRTFQSSWQRNYAPWDTTLTPLREGLCGEAEAVVVEAASAADRILLTLDKGIADARSRRRAGVVLFRPDSAGRGAVLSFIRERISTIASMDPSRVRLR